MNELADTSAWIARRRDPELSRAFAESVARREVAICDPVRFEILRTARDVDDFRVLRAELDALPQVAAGSRVWRRALDVFEGLAEQGPLHHRGIPLADLLVAAAAELAGIGVVHYDGHFDRIAEVTGQPVRAIAPLGSL